MELETYDSGKTINSSAKIRKASGYVYFFESCTIIEHPSSLPKVYEERKQMPGL